MHTALHCTVSLHIGATQCIAFLHTGATQVHRCPAHRGNTGASLSCTKGQHSASLSCTQGQHCALLSYTQCNTVQCSPANRGNTVHHSPIYTVATQCRKGDTHRSHAHRAAQCIALLHHRGYTGALLFCTHGQHSASLSCT
jgi:hypothetical protein